MGGLFGTGWYSRLRRWGYAVSQEVGPISVHGETSFWAFPWPTVGTYLEPGELTLGFRLDGGMTDSLLSLALTVRLPVGVTELIHRVKDYEDEYMGRSA